jgi:hypothetical protein
MNEEKIKPIRFVCSEEDITDLKGTSDYEAIIRRLKEKFSCGTHLDDVIVIYPHIIAETLKEEDKIIKKLTYTAVHELIHNLLCSVSLNSENNAHGLSMLILNDTDSNLCGIGFETLEKFQRRHIEIIQELTLDDFIEETES